MSTQQIKRAKRLAEILGIDDLEERDGRLLHMASDGPLSIMPVGEFNPEQDKALLWDLMLKYHLIVNHDGIVINKSHTVNRMFFNERDIPAALIDCVIEINGGYDAARN